MDRESRDHHAGHAGGYDGGYRRGLGRRPTTDYGSSMVRWMRNRRPLYKGSITPEAERPSASYVVDMLLPAARPYNAADTVPTKHLHSSLNKIKHPINIVRWTPEGRRCLTGSSSGEFTLWNGMAFNFETIMQAHDAAIRAAAYSHGEDWLISADHDGVVKYWQPNFNNVKALQAHNDAVRDIAFSPNDGKFVTACDDATLKIFDFAGGTEESALKGHNWDVKSVDWHPTKGLLVSGSKDHQVKLWDPRTERCLTTLHGHKNTISKTLFEPNRGQLLATCARDQTARIFDLRMMRDICLLKGHEKEISTLTWHPIHASLLTTGGADGSIFHFLLDEPNAPLSMTPSLLTYDSSDPTNTAAQAIYPAHRVQYAHDFAIWSLSWHPLGHILASGSNDRVTRFWTRSRPGESRCFNDRYHLGEAGAEAHGTWDRRGGHRTLREEEEQEVEDEAEGLVDQKMPAKPPLLPGLPGLAGAVGAANDRIDPPINLHIPARTVNGSNTAPPGMPSSAAIAGIHPHQFANMIAEGQIIVPPPPIGQHFLPPPPPNFDISKLPPEILANFPMPAGFPPPPHISNIAPTGQTRAPIAHDGRPAIPEVDYGGSSGIRKRAPLPSQHESLLQEQRKGNFRTAR